MRERRRATPAVAAGLLLLVLPGILGGLRATPRQEQAKPAGAAQKAAPAEYAGSEACAVCHEEARVAALEHHGELESNKRLGWAGRSCEACHLPAKAHTESADINQILSFKRAPATRVNQACLTCHRQGLRKTGHSFDAHSRSSVSCVSCHSVHKPSGGTPLLQEPAGQLCATCHADVQAQFARPYRHKLLEGVMKCVDCHNPHGTPQRPQLHRVAGNDAACAKCHGDKRGPFVFEHPPMRLEGCAACHEPHGSVNPRQLKRAEIRFQCLECHTNSMTATLGASPPAFHDLRSPRFQNCTSCHWKIHGSHVDRAFLR